MVRVYTNESGEGHWLVLIEYHIILFLLLRVFRTYTDFFFIFRLPQNSCPWIWLCLTIPICFISFIISSISPYSLKAVISDLCFNVAPIFSSFSPCNDIAYSSWVYILSPSLDWLIRHFAVCRLIPIRTRLDNYNTVVAIFPQKPERKVCIEVSKVVMLAIVGGWNYWFEWGLYERNVFPRIVCSWNPCDGSDSIKVAAVFSVIENGSSPAFSIFLISTNISVPCQPHLIIVSKARSQQNRNWYSPLASASFLNSASFFLLTFLK